MCANKDYDYCAGTLPYALYNNSLYMLMGKSRRGKLVTFSGKNEDLENPAQTASREMFEETCGVIMSEQEILKCINHPDSLTLRSQTPRGKSCYIIMFQIPYKKWYSVAFTRAQDTLKSIVPASDANKYSEMVDLKWVSVDSLCTNVRRMWDANRMTLAESEWAKIRGLAVRLCGEGFICGTRHGMDVAQESSRCECEVDTRMHRSQHGVLDDLSQVRNYNTRANNITATS